MPPHPAACLILVVDDERPIRELLLELIEELGHHGAGVEDGAAALAWLHSHPRPDLILLDLMMPIMDGAAFRQRQRRDPDLATIPTVVMSADFDAVKNRDGLQATAYLHKPLDLSAGEELIADCR